MAFASPCLLTPSTMPSSVHCIDSDQTRVSILYCHHRADAKRRVPVISLSEVLRRLIGIAGTSPAMTELGLLLRKLQAHRPITLGVVTPALAHLHEQEQVHLALGDLFDFAARGFADRPDRRAALAEHDLALALALDIDRLLDAHGIAAQILPLLGLDSGVVRQ